MFRSKDISHYDKATWNPGTGCCRRILNPSIYSISVEEPSICFIYGDLGSIHLSILVVSSFALRPHMEIEAFDSTILSHSQKQFQLVFGITLLFPTFLFPFYINRGVTFRTMPLPQVP